MKRGTKVAIGLGVAGLLGAAVFGIAAVRWWQRQHSVGKLAYHPPVITATAPKKIRLLPVAIGFEHPSDIQFVPGGGTRAVVLEQAGHARLVDLGPALAGGAPAVGPSAPLVLDLWVRALSEMGLLGLAFHPRYPERGTLYVYYEPWERKVMPARIAEFTLPADEIGRHPAVQSRVLLEFEQKLATHQGGGVAFGPDGRLYVGLGDGGSANDSFNHAQDLGDVHGKILRFDVDGPTLVPRDNPFLKKAGARPEVWAYGLRNPWRFSFDGRGHVIAGDIGQEGREELDLISAGDNLGWKLREGRICSQTAPHCPTAGFVEPILDYDRSVGACIVGGFLVTGARVPLLKGKYVFADYVRGRIWAMTLPDAVPAAGAAAANPAVELLGEWPRLFSSLGRDANGDLYIADQVLGEVLAIMPLP